MATAVKALLVEAIKDALQAACIDDIGEDDESRAGLVMIGRYQDDPSTQGIVITVHADHVLGPDREEHRNTQGERQRDGYEWNLPAETIGGSFFRWGRGTVLVHYFLSDKTREEAVTEVTEIVTERIVSTLHDSGPLVGIEDTEERMVHALEVTDVSTYSNEVGEPSTGRTFIDWRALISSTRRR